MATQLHQTAYSGTKKCFVCGIRRNASTRMHSIPFETIKEAYQKHSIIIKKHVVCCLRHFDNFGCVNRHELRLQPVCTTTIRLLDSFVKNKPTPFERF